MELLNKIPDTIRKLSLFVIFIPLAWGAHGQAPHAVSALELLGTRSWIRVKWKDDASNIQGFNIYWSTKNNKPKNPSARIGSSERRYYIQHVKKQTLYYVWVEDSNNLGKSKPVSGKVFTKVKWSLNPDEAKHLDPPSSGVVPQGMRLFWHDEFNDELLNRNKWFTDYYSTIDFLRKVNYQALIHNNLPKAAYKLNGKYIDLFVNDSLPKRAFEDGKKISSIQTYDWSTDENLLDDSKGGYFEVRVRRGSTGKVQGLNTAFWFDSPGPNLKYYLPVGATADGTNGIRPQGQLFEIDMFENLNAQFVMHGRVDSNGRFIHNLATDIAWDYDPKKYVTDSGQWVTFGLLWTPTSIKHYINGKLIKSYDDINHIYSPNHVMNILLGSYGKGGTVNLQVDYVRYYRWPIADSNELPDPGFEADTTLLPWDGTGTLSASAKRSGQYGVLLKPNQYIEQYVYLNNNKNYQMKYWARGKSNLRVEIGNVQQVTGKLENVTTVNDIGRRDYSQRTLSFKTKKLYGNDLRTVRIAFFNTGHSDISLDDISIGKAGR